MKIWQSAGSHDPCDLRRDQPGAMGNDVKLVAEVESQLLVRKKLDVAKQVLNGCADNRVLMTQSSVEIRGVSDGHHGVKKYTQVPIQSDRKRTCQVQQDQLRQLKNRNISNFRIS